MGDNPFIQKKGEPLNSSFTRLCTSSNESTYTPTFFFGLRFLRLLGEIINLFHEEISCLANRLLSEINFYSLGVTSFRVLAA